MSARRTERILRLGGEFVVIVVGVLIALAVDQWVGTLADRDAEEQYLAALVRDLDADLEFLTGPTGTLPLLMRADSALREVGPVARGTAPFPSDTIAFLRRVITSRRTVAISSAGNPTFQELVSTGSLRLIRSADLRTALIGYYSLAENVEARGQERSSGYAALVRGILPDDPDTGSNVSEAQIRGFGVDGAARSIREPEFVRALNRHVAYVRFLLPAHVSLQEELESLRRQANEELARIG